MDTLEPETTFIAPKSCRLPWAYEVHGSSRAFVIICCYLKRACALFLYLSCLAFPPPFWWPLNRSVYCVFDTSELTFDDLNWLYCFLHGCWCYMIVLQLGIHRAFSLILLFVMCPMRHRIFCTNCPNWVSRVDSGCIKPRLLIKCAWQSLNTDLD